MLLHFTPCSRRALSLISWSPNSSWKCQCGEESQYLNPLYCSQGALGSVQKHMCQGLMRSAAALLLAGMVKPRPMPFNSEEQYFEQRFFVFTQIAAPAPLSYEDYSTVMSLAGWASSSTIWQYRASSSAWYLKESAFLPCFILESKHTSSQHKRKEGRNASLLPDNAIFPWVSVNWL